MRSNALDRLRNVLRDNATGSEAEHRQTMLSEFNASNSLREEIFAYWFAKMYPTFSILRTGDHSTAVFNAEKARREGKRVAKIVQGVVQRVLMDQVLSTGNALRHSTFAECAREGGWLSLVATKGKPSQVVGKHLTEAQLQYLRQRIG